jgi:hypothetical protein
MSYRDELPSDFYTRAIDRAEERTDERHPWIDRLARVVGPEGYVLADADGPYDAGLGEP